MLKEKRQLDDAVRFRSGVGVGLHAILGCHLTDAKGHLKRQILKYGQMLDIFSVRSI